MSENIIDAKMLILHRSHLCLEMVLRSRISNKSYNFLMTTVRTKFRRIFREKATAFKALVCRYYFVKYL